ncbi:hypothetical protein RHGRI_019094 [Rhododendron griersonianum]|uniref:Riboflavin biosynthesis protein PYRD, chloroplastic n=1 Tax=Rhododendron griersonianum TaxID=479676 RepID=A0AAV6JIJ8_9ERIC|nr:hypothetical protein RHGRI_019094 [Rhododendron griersonianum]
MFLQTPSVSRYSLGPSNSKLVPFPISRSGLCFLTKRVCKSVTSGGRHGGFVGIRCQGEDDGFYMRRCVEIARKGIGCSSPNPMVGCVVVKDGKIVGEGFHPKAGQPHAEVFALRDAGDLAENSTAYVSLEPCNHYGRTPPCTEALIKAKVKKVVVGMVDPNPIVASKGVDRLRDAGIDVTVGVEGELCKKLIEAFTHLMLTGKPFVTLRYSLSVDGHFSDQLGEEVTKPGGYYSQLLQEYDAVILSSTLLRENFSLPVSEEPGANQPLQIIIARSPSSPIQVPVITTEASSKVVVFTDKETSVEPEMAQKGIETVVLDGMNLMTILEYCKRRGLCSILLDIRGNIGDFEEMLREGFEGNLLQKVVVEMLPIWKGSKEERFPVAFTSLGQRLRLRNLSSRNSCQSVLLEGYF